LQADGWYLRTDIVWNKPNCQPESVKDRPTRSHEFVFLFSKSEKYFYDWASVLEPAMDRAQNGKNRRTVWNINTEPYKGAHFAVFPRELARTCILAGSNVGDRVLDPFFGSGTTGVVCNELDRQCTGIELNPEYAELAKRRLSQRR
jgi:site-specific DNA-methyltransferase (adenine-specific)/site-specific DNA-methyltransferase (cytosine-N4-specific)